MKKLPKLDQLEEILVYYQVSLDFLKQYDVAIDTDQLSEAIDLLEKSITEFKLV